MLASKIEIQDLAIYKTALKKENERTNELRDKKRRNVQSLDIGIKK